MKSRFVNSIKHFNGRDIIEKHLLLRTNYITNNKTNACSWAIVYNL